MAGGRPWTEIEERRAHEMWKLGRSDEQIGEALGRTPTAVGRKRLDIGACVRRASKPSTMEHKRCVALKGKMSASQIAAKLGITRNAVIGHWHRDKLAAERTDIRRYAA